jgi:hypothetical protein
MRQPEATVVRTLSYQRRSVEKGYTGHFLNVDLSCKRIAVEPIGEKIKKRFIGGKGLICGCCGRPFHPQPNGTIPKMPSASPQAPWGERPPIPVQERAS